MSQARQTESRCVNDTMIRHSSIGALLCRAPFGKVASSALDTQIAEKQGYGFIWNQEADNPQHRQMKDCEIFELMDLCKSGFHYIPLHTIRAL